MMGDVSVAVDPDDGAQQLPHSAQVSTSAKLTVTWTSMGAAKVRIDPLGTFDASGSTDLPSQDADYSLVAVAEDGTESTPFPLSVHTHDPDDAWSAHSEVSPVPADWVLGFRIVPHDDDE